MQIKNTGEPEPRQIRLLNVEEAREFVTGKIAAGELIVLDIFGGEASQNPEAINFDRVAEEGLRAEIAELVAIFPANSANEIIASGPRAPFLEAAASILKPGGLLYINANFGNRYRFGTSRGKKPPDAKTLSRLGLRLLRDEPSLDPRFNNLVFRREDGSEIPRETVRTVIFEKEA